MKKLLTPVKQPKSFIMTMNAGAIPADHWTQDRDIGGGRIIGQLGSASARAGTEGGRRCEKVVQRALGWNLRVVQLGDRFKGPSRESFQRA